MPVRRLKKGTVIRGEDAGTGKIKRLILMGLDTDTMMAKLLFINSKRPRNAISDITVKRFYPFIDPSDGPHYKDFLDHGSIVECYKVQSRNFDRLMELLRSGEFKIIGQLKQDHIDKYTSLVLQCDRIDEDDQLIIDAPLVIPPKYFI